LVVVWFGFPYAFFCSTQFGEVRLRNAHPEESDFLAVSGI
jgi:hypothetical protein